MSTREQITQAATELRKLIDRIEEESLRAQDAPTMEQLAAFDAHRRVIDSTLMVLRRTLVRRVEREQSKTEPEAEPPADQTAPQQVMQTKRPTTRPR